jgi:8-oxo-dGTP pyrophosphatase MutT (NUDIX family)
VRTEFVVSGIILRAGQVLLVHHGKLGKWLFPGGHAEPGEVPDDALVREIREETGLLVEPMDRATIPTRRAVVRELAIPFYAHVHSVGDHLHCCFFYRCRIVGGELKLNQEVTSFMWRAPDELDEAVPDDVRYIAAFAARRR